MAALAYDATWDVLAEGEGGDASGHLVAFSMVQDTLAGAGGIDVTGHIRPSTLPNVRNMLAEPASDNICRRPLTACS